MNFSKRSYQKELLDRDDIPAEDIRRNMQELDFINTWLGGHGITLQGFRDMLTGPNNQNRTYTVCEIGCGGGDNLWVINNWCRKNGIKVKLIGIDINPDCIAVAREKLGFTNAELIQSDYKTAQFHQPPDIIYSSLFCHHFVEEDLVFMMRWMNSNAGSGFFVNDLQRHPLAFHSIRLLTKLFSSSYLVKHDAPLSVLRGFSRTEWLAILETAGITNFQVKWKWAFRYLVTVKRKRS